jgi:predicted AAA+ superfamily ATPase
MNRSQSSLILKDLEKKIALLVGPRQVGKTWLSKQLMQNFDNPLYLNFDNVDDRHSMEKALWPKKTDFLVLDELQKMPDWGTFLKGVFDTKNESLRILVTGSSRLDLSRLEGDSLLGRFYLHHLLPFSFLEVNQESKDLAGVDRLLERGGFPEPFLSKDPVDVDRWRMLYSDGILYTDIIEYGGVMDNKAMRLIFELLQRKVGSPISLQGIAEDVGISPHTVKKYITIMEALYIVFLVYPYSNNIARSLSKPPKVYFFDNGLVVGDSGKKFENLMALSLLKHVFGLKDYMGVQYTLSYLRTKEGKEVDFCLSKNNEIDEIIEAKVSDATISPQVRYFTTKYGFHATQVVKELRQQREENGILVIDAESYLQSLFL